MGELLLFSAGLDSFPAWHYLGRPPALYCDLGHRYAAQERRAVAALAQRCGIEVEVSEELRLGAWEAPDAIIPLRNVHLAMLAANRADVVWCVGVLGDHTADKSPRAFSDISRLAGELSGRRVRVDSPFWHLTKTDVVGWYLAQGLPVEDLMLTFSCSRSDGRTTHCGRCPSCLRRWVALANNGVDGDFTAPPWQWERVREFYVPAMRDGTYPDHRAAELFTALATVGLTADDLTGGALDTPSEHAHPAAAAAVSRVQVRAYVAAPLFCEAEKAFNLRVDAAVQGLGITTFLPQRDGGEAAPLVRQGRDEHTVRHRLFELDRAAVRDCDLFVFVLDGRVPDEGGCVELGMAHTLGKTCFGLQTDSRRFGGTDSNNLMIDYALTGGTAHSIDELTALLRRHVDLPADHRRRP